MMENQKLSAERLAWIKEHYGGVIDLEMDHARAHIQLLLMHIGAIEAEKAEIIRSADDLIDEKVTKINALIQAVAPILKGFYRFKKKGAIKATVWVGNVSVSFPELHALATILEDNVLPDGTIVRE